MASVALVPALALIAGAATAVGWDRLAPSPLLPALLAVAAWGGWVAGRNAHARFSRVACTLLFAASFFCAAAALTVDAREAALYAPLRTALDRAFGGFALDTPGPGGAHDPVPVRAVLLEDASPDQGFVSLRARVSAIRVGERWQATDGRVTFAVGGVLAAGRIEEWRAGRSIETFATFRRPARYLNEGVPDFERQLALDGTTLFGSVKSGLLIDMASRGGALDEAAAAVRQHARHAIERWVATHAGVSAAIVTAVLIGDRTGLPDDVRLRLQAAGTYHVIAISGGNIAILAALTLGILLLCGVTGRSAALLTIATLLAYAYVVTTSASVWRATLMAMLYLAARLLDHRSPPWQAMAMAAALLVCVRPLDVRDAGFILTFGATAALLEAARRVGPAVRGGHMGAWVAASIAASIAVEVALLPVNASTFSRVTGAGLVLNLCAVPLMALVQIGGIVVALFDRVHTIAAFAGWVAHTAAAALVGSAQLVDAAPWMVARVPPPVAALVIAYYAALAVALSGRGIVRAGGAAALSIAAVAVVTGQPGGWLGPHEGRHGLRVTAFDVGQADATLVEFPGRSTLLVDAGGIPFGGGSFDIGSRVLAPALWERGVRRLDTLLVTHGDPDHIGGAAAVISDFAPAQVWEGIPVAGHAGLAAVLDAARQLGARVEPRRAGETLTIDGTRVRVLHPPVADWARRQVRNDDSVVLEIQYGDAAVLLLGDVGAAVERTVVPQLTPARVRILKVAHHGSRTSTSRELLEAWRPQIAIVSCGRGNTFGHPAPEVLQRLQAVGAAIYRTDRDGQITIETDGIGTRIRTYVRRPGPQTTGAADPAER